MELMDYPSQVVTLSNGKRVANFSSPHSFKFADGNELSGHDAEWAEKYKILFHEVDMGDGDVELSFSLPDEVKRLMYRWQQLHDKDMIDVVYVPLPMLQAMITDIQWYDVKNTPFRSIRMENRIDKLVSIHKQTIMTVDE